MTNLSKNIDVEEFISAVESLERTQRPEYIFENLWKVKEGSHTILWEYAIEARIYWEARCCSMLEYTSPDELYQEALKGLLPKVDKREKLVLQRLARALHDDSRFYTNISQTDDHSLVTCYQAEALLKHINNKRELLRLYVHLPVVLRKRSIDVDSLMSINQKALELAEDLAEQEMELYVLNNFGRMYEYKHDFLSALEYYQKALTILDRIIQVNEIDDSPNTIPQEFLLPKAGLLYNIANCKGILGNIRDTVTIGTQAAAFANRLQKNDIAVHIEQLLARAYSILGVHHIALKHVMIAASLAESINSPYLIGQTKMFVAVVYSKMGDYHKAIEYGLQALPSYETHESITEYIVVSGRVGGMMVSAGEFNRAQTLFGNLLTLIENADKSMDLARQKSLILRQLSRISIHQQHWNEALAYIRYPIEILQNDSDLPHLMVETLVVATDAYIGAKMYDKAINFALQTLNLTEASKDLQSQYVAHSQLATIAELQGDYTTAFFHYKKFHHVKEQLFNNESDQRSKNMAVLLEEQEAIHNARVERLRRYQLEEEIGQLSTTLVYQEQALKEIRTTLRSMKFSTLHVEQITNVLQSVLKSAENSTSTNTSKTYKMIDDKIESAFPSLTRIQRELCRFIILGHSTKDIAGLMRISPQSVNTQRYRIRIRLGLSETDSLDYILKKSVKQHDS
jgi:tetratricopeptide (TPR) repeat protein